MKSHFRLALFFLLTGVLTLYAVLFRTPPKQDYKLTDVRGADSNLELFIEPDDGRDKLLNLIGGTNRQLLTEVYLLSDPEIIAAFKRLQTLGVDVRIILEEHPFGGGVLNQKTRADLELNNIKTVWSNPLFTLTHEKTIIIDDRIVCILNLNLTKAAFDKNREYNICSQNPQDVSDATQIFWADWNRTQYLPTSPNLVVSPDNSRGKLTTHINGATQILDLEIEVLNDRQMIDLLSQKAKDITVRIILPDFKKIDNRSTAYKLISAGAQVKTLSSPYPHAKLVVADRERAYLGSVNFTSQSLDQNRELGILVSQPDIIGRLENTFEKDWEKAVSP